MIRITTFAGKTVAVFGLGASGNATVAALLAGAASVAAWDDSEAGRAASERSGLTLTDLRSADWSQFAALVLAPGVPLTHPEPHWTVLKAQAAGVEIIGDIELYCRERAKTCPEAPFIAITGTNGKSTTTALIAHILREAGKDVQMGGNIGRAILTLEPPATDRYHVIEMSSFQIDLTPSLKPTVGVMLNVTPDHIDRHGSVEHYAEVKERLVAGSETAIIGIDDGYCRAIHARAAKRGQDVLAISTRSLVGHGVIASGRSLMWASAGKGKEIANLSGIGSLRGTHNAQNAAAAVAAVAVFGVTASGIQKGLSSFPGLAHRMEEIGRIGKVLYINDSKATNADSTAKALASWQKDIFWILGGKPKEGGITTLEACFPRVVKAYLIGEASDDFAATLEGKVDYERCITLDNALVSATRDAEAATGAEPVVLLSPACASYDQYKNFEVRGDRFRSLVATLPGVQMRQRTG